MEHNHDHDHSPAHNHSHEPPASLKNLVFAMVINGGIVAFEMVFGLMIQSMALISDAVHNLSDIAAMIFSYWAEKVSRRPANYGKNVRLPQNRVYRRLRQQHRPVRRHRLRLLGDPQEIHGAAGNPRQGDALGRRRGLCRKRGGHAAVAENLGAELQHEKRLAPFASGRPVFPRGDRRRPADHLLRLASRRSPHLAGHLHRHRP